MNIPKTSSIQTQQLTRTLQKFYQKPVAQVSTELFFTVGTIIFFALFAIRPTILTMTDLVKEIEDKRKTKEALDKKYTALQTVQTEFFALQDQFSLLDETVPEDPDFKQVFKIVEKMASDRGLSINSMQLREIPAPQDPTIPFRSKAPQSAIINLIVEGDFNEIRQFIQDVTNLRPLMTLGTINFAKNTLEENATTITSAIQLEFHYYSQTAKEAEPKKPAAAEEPLL